MKPRQRTKQTARENTTGPVLLQVRPRAFAPGDQIVLSGNGFSRYPAWNQVFIGGYPATVLEASTNRLSIEVPLAARDNGLVEVSVDGACSLPFECELKTKLVTRQCPGLADNAAEVLGTSLPALICTTLRSPGGFRIKEYEWSRLWCGHNQAIIRCGGAESPYLRVSHSLVGFNNYLLCGYPNFTLPILFSLDYIQLVSGEETDPVTGEKRTVYYFFRAGRWWRIRDNERMHPEEPTGIDLREDVADPNFGLLPPEREDELNRRFFPTGWQDFWREFDERSRIQLQIMAAVLSQMQGMDKEDLELFAQIREMMRQGKTLDEIWEAKQERISWLLIFGLGGAALGGVGGVVLRNPAARRYLRRFLMRLFGRRRYLRRMTRVRESDDLIELDIHERYRPKGGQGGLQGNLNGRVDAPNGTLRSDPGAEEWINSTGEKGLATELMEEFIEILKEFARRKGLRRVELKRVASTEKGADLLRRSGFEPVPGKTNPDGTGIWRRVIELEPN